MIVGRHNATPRVNGLEFHTLSDEKTFQSRLVVCGLDVGSKPTTVADEIRSLRLYVIEAILLYSTHDARFPLPLIRVSLPKSESVDRLLALASLCGIRIKVEGFGTVRPFRQ